MTPDPDKSRMLTPQNVMKTSALFIDECWGTDQSSCYYTLSPFHRYASDEVPNTKAGYPSIYQLYLEMSDPTEFNFANTYFLGMDHWRKLEKAPFFKPHLEKMRSDLELKLKAEAVQRIREEATKESSKNYFQSLKWLAEKGYAEKAAKGRPSKAQVERAAKDQAEQNTELKDILGRLNLTKEKADKKELN